MIRREQGEFCITCDICGETEHGGTVESFLEFWKDCKEQGWRATRVVDTWEHACPECNQKE